MKTGTLEVDVTVQECEVWTRVRAVGMEAEPLGLTFKPVHTGTAWVSTNQEEDWSRPRRPPCCVRGGGRRSQGLCGGSGSLFANQYQSISAF